MHHGSEKGFGLVEVIVGLSILSIAMFALITVSRAVLVASRAATQNLQAGFLVEEGVEAIRSIRDRGYAQNISTLSGTSSLYFDTGSSTNPKWVSTTTPEIIDNLFYRTFRPFSVGRNVTDDIQAVGGIVDANTKRFMVSVVWKSPTGTSSRQISTYLTNYFND